MCSILLLWYNIGTKCFQYFCANVFSDCLSLKCLQILYVHWHTCCTNLWMLEGRKISIKNKNKCVTSLACVSSSNTAAESWPHLCSDCVNVSRSDTCINQKKQIKFYPGQEKYADTATSYNQDRPPEHRGHWFRGTVRPEAVQHNTRKLFQEDGRMSFFDLLIS